MMNWNWTEDFSYSRSWYFHCFFLSNFLTAERLGFPSQLLNLRKKMLGTHLRLLLVRTQFSFVARRSVVAHTNTYLTCWRHVDQLAHVYSNTPVHPYQNFQILLLISIKLFKYCCSIFERNEKSQTNHWQLSSFENRRMRLTVAKQNTKWSCW
jgi:nitric oxide reductase large subunit